MQQGGQCTKQKYSCPHRLTRLEDPLQVPVQFSLNLLLPTELQEGTTVLYSLPLLGELSIHVGEKSKQLQ